MRKLRVAVIERGALADVLRGVGNPSGQALEVSGGRLASRLTSKEVGVGYVEGRTNALPHFLVVPNVDRREFFAWANTYCPFVTPLSQWCRVVKQNDLATFESLEIVPEYGSASAAWSGAIVGEALLYVGSVNGLSQVSVTALQSCMSFVAARAFGLWKGEKTARVSVREFEKARRLLGLSSRESSLARFEAIWSVLEIMSGNVPHHHSRVSPQTDLIVQCCRSIVGDGFVDGELIAKVVKFLKWPDYFVEYERCGSEKRLEIFDQALGRLAEGKANVTGRDGALAEFTVAYFAARIGGDITGLMRLIERGLERFPTLALWYGVASALYRPEIWGVEFFGLGRLAIKEISFPMRFEDPPRCDVSCEELMSLIDSSGAQSSFGFRGASLTALNVEVAPGVNGMIRLPIPVSADQASRDSKWDELRMETENLERHLKVTTDAAERLSHIVGVSASGGHSGTRIQERKQKSQSNRSGKSGRIRRGGQLPLDPTC